MEEVSLTPKRSPSMWLDKDWTNRECRIFKGTEEVMERIHEFEVKDDDVWIVTMFKCGTTWMQELAWLLLNFCDFEKALATDVADRSPFIEFGTLLPSGIYDSVGIAEKHPSPRLIESHLPLPLLTYQVWTKKPKIIYVFRNPKDAAVSGYYFDKVLGRALEPKEEYLKQFIEDNDEFWLHVHEFWSLRNEPNVYYTSYEKMKSNLAEVIEGLSKFLDVSLNEGQISRMLEHLSFENMKNNVQCNHGKRIEFFRKHFLGGKKNVDDNAKPLNDSSNRKLVFIRKGQVGGYKDDFTKELDEQYDRWINEHLQPHNVTLDELLLQSRTTPYI